MLSTWYQKDFDGNMNKNKGYEKREHGALENVYGLDKEHTYRTLNERPGRYAGSPGAVPLDLGEKERKHEVITVGD